MRISLKKHLLNREENGLVRNYRMGVENLDASIARLKEQLKEKTAKREHYMLEIGKLSLRPPAYDECAAYLYLKTFERPNRMMFSVEQAALLFGEFRAGISALVAFYSECLSHDVIKIVEETNYAFSGTPNSTIVLGWAVDFLTKNPPQTWVSLRYHKEFPTPWATEMCRYVQEQAKHGTIADLSRNHATSKGYGPEFEPIQLETFLNYLKRNQNSEEVIAFVAGLNA